MTNSFPHLHVASGYSLRYGVNHPQVLVARAVDRGLSTLALTDRDGLYGAVKFVQACSAAGVRPVLGVDLALERAASGAGRSSWVGVRTEQVGRAEVRRTARSAVRGGTFRADPTTPRVVLLAEGRAGWASLCRLVSAAHRAGGRGRPVASLELVATYARGLVALLGPASPVGQALATGAYACARRRLEAWRDVLGVDNLAIEVVHHRAEQDGLRAARAIELSRDTGVPAVLTNAVRFADRRDAPVADVLDAARQLVLLDPARCRRRGSEEYLKDGEEMAVVARAAVGGVADGAGAARALVIQTQLLAARCTLDPSRDLGIGEVHVPEFGGTGTPPLAVLRSRCRAGVSARGVAARWGARAVDERLSAELDVIAHLDFAAYFLTVADVVALVKDLGVRCAARGSAAGSLVAFLLGISDVDPLEHGLLMERFLSPRRRELPDIDLDVESARRIEVVEKVVHRYGAERCACVAMMETYRARQAIRDVGTVLGLDPGEVDVAAKAFPHIRADQVRSALRDLPELQTSGLAGGKFGLLFSLVERLDGLPRHIALHPCGILLSDRSLLSRTPVETSGAGFPMSEFDKDDVEALGFLKLDVLGVRMQSAIAHALAEVERVDGQRIDLGRIPTDDPATFALIGSTRTIGCFQIESPGQRELIGKFLPQTIGDLIVDISLFRPGPVASDMVRPFLEVRQGWRPPAYPHPDLVPILAETCGVVVFHEQVLRIIARMASVSLAEADEVRRALGDVDGQREARTWFLAAALRTGYTPAVVEEVWTVLAAFGSFGFCKAHAAAFAVPTYQSAWLKAHHPAYFLAGVLTHDPGMYPRRMIVEEARRLGVRILPLDVNVSDAAYRVEVLEAPAGRVYGIRLALGDVKGMAAGEVSSVLAGRPYSSVRDFWARAGLSRPSAERCVLAGGLDSIYGLQIPGAVRGRDGLTRRDLLVALAEVAGRSKAREPVREGRVQPDLEFSPSCSGTPYPEASTPARGLPEMSGAERVRAELDVLGVDASHHVLDFYADFLEAIGVTRSRQLLGCRSQQTVLVAGVKVATQTPPVRSGRRVIFVTLDDTTGPVDATFFEDAQVSSAAVIFHSWLLVIRGSIRRTGARSVSVRADTCWNLPTLVATWRMGGLRAVREVLDPPGPGPHRLAGGGLAPPLKTPPEALLKTPPAAAPGPESPGVIEYATGFRQSAYADARAPGAGSPHAPRRVWHSSPGSAGR